MRLLRGGGCAAAADVISVAAAARCSIALAPSMVGAGAAAGMRCAKRSSAGGEVESLREPRERGANFGQKVVARGNRGLSNRSEGHRRRRCLS